MSKSDCCGAEVEWMWEPVDIHTPRENEPILMRSEKGVVIEGFYKGDQYQSFQFCGPWPASHWRYMPPQSWEDIQKIFDEAKARSTSIKLTPEQVKAIRWPSDELYQEQESHKAHVGHQWELKDFGDWAIRYALQYLVEEEK